jgi:glucokinase
VQRLARRAKKEQLNLIGAGVAFAGKVDTKTGIVKQAPNILFLENYNLTHVFKKAAGVRSVVGNDVQLALYGEHQLGAARDYQHVLGVFFGTGVGGAAIINGRIYHGASDMGGQVGSLLTHHIGGSETLESHGTLDRIASKAAIGGAALGMGVKQWAPHLYKEVGTDFAKLTWGALERARKKGDKRIEELIRSRLRVAGIALASVVNFMNPEILILGGGLTEEMPRLVQSEVEGGLREHLVSEVSRKLKVKTAKFKNRAGVFGAAKLAFRKFA